MARANIEPNIAQLATSRMLSERHMNLGVLEILSLQVRGIDWNVLEDVLVVLFGNVAIGKLNRWLSKRRRPVGRATIFQNIVAETFAAMNEGTKALDPSRPFDYRLTVLGACTTVSGTDDDRTIWLHLPGLFHVPRHVGNRGH